MPPPRPGGNALRIEPLRDSVVRESLLTQIEDSNHRLLSSPCRSEELLVLEQRWTIELALECHRLNKE